MKNNQPKSNIELTKEVETLEQVVHDLHTELKSVHKELEDVKENNGMFTKAMVVLGLICLAILYKL